jgi:predicted nucleic acid-binding protein
LTRIFVDTNVLFPFSVMDLMLAPSEDGVHDVMWTDRLLDEWERVIVRERQRSADAAAGITAAVREFFADTRVPEETYLGVVDSIDGPDSDDRFHIAAAIAAQVSTLITWNTADFQSAALERNGVVVMDPDTYLQGLLDEIPGEVVATIRRLAAGKRCPPMAATDLADALAKAGVPLFADAVRDRLAQHHGNPA